MKTKTSVALDVALLGRIDKSLEKSESRSSFMEQAAQALVAQREKAKRDAKDAAILAAKAEHLNAQALENLEFVSDIFEDVGLEKP
jgi:metal-responsive CopG/Arc/MetJ family transcriptional regulator